MTKTWIVVADASRARIFSAPSPVAQLTEEADFINTEKPHIDSDRPGRSFNRQGSHRHGMEPKHTPKQNAVSTFTRRLTDHIEHARKTGQFANLVLVAAPSVLGLIRNNLDDKTAKLLSSEISKDVVGFEAPEIRKLLP